MTKATLPFTFADAVKRTTARIDDTELARLFGRSWSSTVQAWRNDTNPRWPRIDQALALDLAYAAAGGAGSPFLDAFQVMVDAAIDGANRQACRIALGAGVAALQKENSDLIAAIIDVLQPNATQREFRRAMVEAQDVGTCTDDVVRLLNDFSGICDAGSRAGKPGGIL